MTEDEQVAPSLHGKVAMVVGASRGIGMGAAIELGAHGAFVYALGRTLEPGTGGATGSLRETAEAIATLGGQARAVQCDAGDLESLQAVVAEIERGQGRLDILVNSVFSAHQFAAHLGKRMWEIDPHVWQEVVDLPGRATYYAIASAAPLLVATAREDDPALIVNVSGRGAERYRYNVLYGVGKSAIARLGKDAAIELATSNVSVVAVWPNGHNTGRYPETPRYNGRGVVALAADPERMARTGGAFWTAQLARDYGFTDEFGHDHPVAELTDEHSLEHVARAGSLRVDS